MPWRTIEASSTPGAPPGEPPTEVRPPRIARGAVAAVGGAGILAVATFVLAFGSGAADEVTVAGGAPLDVLSSREPVQSAGAAGATIGPGESVVVVEIVGAITRPGVYELPAGSRVGDLIDASGGYGPRVDTQRAARSLNLAAVLSDGDQIRVPSRDETDPDGASGSGGDDSGSGTTGASSLVDLNRASTTELDALPGIGPVTAGKIIAAREEAPFATIEDLRTRKLVGEKTFERLKSLVTVH